MRIIQDKPEIWLYVSVSLLLHLLLIFIVPRLISVPEFKEDVVEIIPITDDALSKSSFKIADIDKPSVEKRPEKAKFVGMYDSTADKETVSTGKVGRAGKPGVKGEKGGEKEDTKTEKVVKPKKEGDKDLYAFNKAPFRKAKKGVGDEGEGAPGGDFFPDFHRGDKTYLNVLRYPDVDYFVRLKRAFRMTFNPAPALQEYFTTNQISRGSIDVVLGVSVDKVGNLSELFVFRSSGIPEYDEEALRTVRASSPFSSPPAKFVDNDNILRMSWTFTVYL